MNATDELRRLLDERGVEWQDQEGPFPITAWESNDVIWVAKAYRTGVFSVETRPVTPEQAIAATLGHGVSEAVAFCKRIEKAVKAGEPLELFGVQYEPVEDEPFCETVARWLNGDAPKECRECTEGEYAELVVKLGRGECEVTSHYYYGAYDIHEFGLSCGHSYTIHDSKPYPYCPECGRRVKGGAE